MMAWLPFEVNVILGRCSHAEHGMRGKWIRALCRGLRFNSGDPVGLLGLLFQFATIPLLVGENFPVILCFIIKLLTYPRFVSTERPPTL